MLSVIGEDEAGRGIAASCTELGIGTRALMPVEGRTATYQALLDGSGELVGAIADMAIFDQITAERVHAVKDEAFAHASLVVCDANVSSDALQAALECSEAAGRLPAWFEPVSVAKSVRGRGLLPWHLVSPNWDELLAMLDRSPMPSLPMPEGLATVGEAVGNALARQLAENVLLTMGPRGVVLASQGPLRRIGHGPFTVHVGELLGEADSPDIAPLCLQVQDVHVPDGHGLWYQLLQPLDTLADVTGAGDALVGGAACAFAAGWPLEEAVVAGMVCAHLTLFTFGAVSPFLANALLPRLKTVLEPRSRL